MRQIKVNQVINPKSSNIKMLAHQDSNLYVEFANGGLYQYQGVSEDVFKRFISADSAGKFFFSKIKNAGYTCDKLEDTQVICDKTNINEDKNVESGLNAAIVKLKKENKVLSDMIESLENKIDNLNIELKEANDRFERYFDESK